LIKTVDVPVVINDKKLLGSGYAGAGVVLPILRVSEDVF
jgi:hypothetical protein